MPSKQMGMNVGRQETIYLYQLYLLRAGFPAGNIKTVLLSWPSAAQMEWSSLANSAGLIWKIRTMFLWTPGDILAPLWFGAQSRLGPSHLIKSPIPVWIQWERAKKAFKSGQIWVNRIHLHASQLCESFYTQWHDSQKIKLKSPRLGCKEGFKLTLPLHCFPSIHWPSCCPSCKWWM